MKYWKKKQIRWCAKIFILMFCSKTCLRIGNRHVLWHILLRMYKLWKVQTTKQCKNKFLSLALYNSIIKCSSNSLLEQIFISSERQSVTGLKEMNSSKNIWQCLSKVMSLNFHHHQSLLAFYCIWKASKHFRCTGTLHLLHFCHDFSCSYFPMR